MLGPIETKVNKQYRYQIVHSLFTVDFINLRPGLEERPLKKQMFPSTPSQIDNMHLLLLPPPSQPATNNTGRFASDGPYICGILTHVKAC